MSIPLSPLRERVMLFTLMALQFTMILDFMIMMPLSSQLMSVFEIQPAQFGILVSAYSIAAGISSLLGSSLGDSFDRRSSLLISFVGLLVATLACAFADTYVLLLTARVIAGFFGGVLSSITLAIVADLFPPKDRGRAMGIVMLGFPLAAIAGVPFGLFIANHFTWHTPFTALVIIGVAIFVVAIYVLPPVRDHLNQPRVGFWQSYIELFSVRNHWWAFITSCLVMFSGFMVIPYIAPTLVANTSLSDHDLPYIYFCGGLGTLLTRSWIGGMTDRYRYSNVLSVVTLLSFVPIILVTQTLQVPFFVHLIFSTLFFILVSGRFIPSSALVAASCEPRFRGRVMSFSSAMQSLGSGVAALVSGAIMVKTPSGEILYYDWVGFAACAVGLALIFAARKVNLVS